jgi:hypothetical protein
MSLARLTDDPALKRQYVDLAAEFARYIGGKGDLDITTAPLTRILKADSDDTGLHTTL